MTLERPDGAEPPGAEPPGGEPDVLGRSGVPRRPSATRRWVGFGAALLAVALLAAAVHRQWDQFAEAMTAIRPQTLVLAGVAVVLGLLCNMMSWRATMASVGARIPVVAGARVFFLSQLGKYVPGSVWPVLAQIELARDRGIGRARSATASLVAMLVGVVTSSVLGSTLVIASQGDAFRRYWWLIAVGLVGAATLYPPVLRRLMVLAARVLRRPTFDVPVAGRPLAVADLWSVTTWVLLGAQAWLLARDLAAAGAPPSFPLMTGAFALSWVVGFLVVPAPAGVGVREAALVVALGGALTPAGALALALVSRVLMTAGDALLAGLCALCRARPAGMPDGAPRRPEEPRQA